MFAFVKNTRFWLAGPVAFILSIVIMAGLSIWLPHDDSDLYHMVFPIIFFPLIWGLCFFYPLLENNLKRATLVMLALLLIHIALIMLSMRA